MVDVKGIGGAGAPTPRPSQAATPAVRAAQRAFFEAAIPPTSPVATTARQAPSPVARAAAPAAPEPGRPLRPGSLLDIKV